MFTPKKRRVERSNDPEVWLRWFNALSNREEGPVDEDDDEAEDDVSVDVSVAEKSDHETESELEVSEEEELHQEQSDLSRSGNIRSSEGEKREDDLDQAHPSNFYIGKNKTNILVGKLAEQTKRMLYRNSGFRSDRISKVSVVRYGMQYQLGKRIAIISTFCASGKHRCI
ncbi:hypothetical protein GEV33_005060 [Tenebrio molitor]|uniref:Uncharacterized protein n=1 Tax=Tenebrio molitor TaxID=7067 RepID=A0A8J6LM40_TENMO|nr:hypothetical protein GEV33_005060 [Tenebrio molitor]